MLLQREIRELTRAKNALRSAAQQFEVDGSRHAAEILDGVVTDLDLVIGQVQSARDRYLRDHSRQP